mmetsp:Transcript_14000/g.25266  ORF Transcript_14000/g.25266 Transcript_14000/m.25266 type:complete len:280 (-) Transcript_14000:68-907(-)
MITGYLLPPLIVTESADDEILGKQIHILLLVLFGISCSTLLLTFFIFKSKPDNMSYEDLHSSRRQMTLLTAFKSSLTNANFWFYGLAFMIVAPIYWDMGTLLNQNMKPAGYSNSEIQIPGILLQTVAIPGMLLTGKLIDAGCKFEYILIFGMVLGTAAFGLFTWILTLESSQMNLVYISLAASAAGFAFSIVQPAYLDLIAQRTAPIPLGYTCSFLYLGATAFGASFEGLADVLKRLDLGIFFTGMCGLVSLASIIGNFCLNNPTQLYIQEVSKRAASM